MTKNEIIIRKVVREMGGIIKRLIPERSFSCIEINGHRIFVTQKFSIADSLFSRNDSTDSKDITYNLLKEAGISTPKTVGIYKKNFNRKKLVKKLNTLSYPVIIKDANGSHSRGVFANIKNRKEAENIIAQEINNFPCLIVQEMIFGKEYRVLILGKRVIGALEMIPPRIFGNGKNTVRDLIKDKQTKTEKQTPFDKSLSEILRKQGETLNSIPQKNKEIFLRHNSCLAEGGEVKDVTNSVNKDIKLKCVEVNKIVGRYLSGVDIICDDIRKSLSEQKFFIIELNRKPDVYIHYKPTHGKTRNVVKDILKFALRVKEKEKSITY